MEERQVRWGKPRKNYKNIDPRYFLFEQQEKQSDMESRLLKDFEKAMNSLSDEELAKEPLEEAEEDKGESLVKSEAGELSLSDETKKYIINFARRRAIGVLSLKLRLLVLGGTKASIGTLLVALKAAGYGPKKILKLTSTDSLDKVAEKLLKQYFPQTADFVYPGETDLKTMAKALVQEFVRMYENTIKSSAKKLPPEKLKQLPEPEELNSVEKDLEDLKNTMGT